tara:strand:- start:77 stop:478 length:402 start_codon:yes stop_codon:yes gene_type:complete
MKKFGVWLFERSIEISGVSTFIIAHERTIRGARGNFLEEFFRTAPLPLIFYIISGYIFSCIYFGLISRQTRTHLQVPIMALAFSVHAFVFFLITSDAFNDYTWKLYTVGLAIVVFASTLGSLILAKRYDSPSS